MTRNTELHFSETPSIDLRRSKFEESYSHKTTFNVGQIIPIHVDSDILPGDTVQLDLASLIRMATPISPVMDNLYADIYFFLYLIDLYGNTGNSSGVRMMIHGHRQQNTKYHRLQHLHTQAEVDGQQEH